MNQTTKSSHLPAPPYMYLGAHDLVAAVYKLGDECCGWRYRWHLFRLTKQGRVSQTYRPADLVAFVKLIQVLASELVHDGCLPHELRTALQQLMQRLDHAHQTDSLAPDSAIPAEVVSIIKQLLDRDLPSLSQIASDEAETRLAQHVIVRQWLARVANHESRNSPADTEQFSERKPDGQ